MSAEYSEIEVIMPAIAGNCLVSKIGLIIRS